VSTESLMRLIDDASRDPALWNRLMEWPQEVLDEYSVSDDELEALRNGNLGQLKEFGVDEYHLVKARNLAA